MPKQPDDTANNGSLDGLRRKQRRRIWKDTAWIMVGSGVLFLAHLFQYVNIWYDPNRAWLYEDASKAAVIASLMFLVYAFIYAIGSLAKLMKKDMG